MNGNYAPRDLGQRLAKVTLQFINKQLKKQQILDIEAIQTDLLTHFFADFQTNERLAKDHYMSSTATLISQMADLNSYYIQHIGKHRAYFFNHQVQQWQQLTRDHSQAEDLRDQLKLNERAFMEDALYRSLVCGESRFIKVELPSPNGIQPELHAFSTYTGRLNIHDALLICDSSRCFHFLPHEWQPLNPEISLENWLREMQEKQHSYNAYNSVDMVLLRLNESTDHGL